ncbi:MAG: hypothetical protein H0Z35_01760 [Thermoanaerobacteraceae bacterium]|nr:hypothetical protein [Thermoanaerobacteraceae bacterium]
MDLKQQFHEDMINIYLRAKKECKYTPTRFLQLVIEKGGVEAAKQLIHKEGGTEGFRKLWEMKRLDLSVEALVLKKKYKELFTDADRAICEKRLAEYDFDFSQID